MKKAIQTTFGVSAVALLIAAPIAQADNVDAVTYQPVKLATSDFQKLAPLAMDNNISSSRDNTILNDMEVGDCYMKVEVAPQYETVEEKMLLSEASERVVVTEPKYKEIKEKILVQEAAFRLEASDAKYKMVTEKVLVTPEREEWRVTRNDDIFSILQNGQRLETRVDAKTGETLCKVKVPAQYTTVSKRVLVKEPQIKRIDIPARYTTLTKRVLVQEAQTRRETIPAKYQTIKTKRMVAPSNIQWVPVLCRTNMTVSRVKELQRSLQKRGFYEGPIDGIYGYLTTRGVSKFQKHHKMVTGGLTIETLNALGLQ